MGKTYGEIPTQPINIAPRGVFRGNYKFKKWKKSDYMITARLIGFYRNRVWQAFSDYKLMPFVGLSEILQYKLLSPLR